MKIVPLLPHIPYVSCICISFILYELYARYVTNLSDVVHLESHWSRFLRSIFAPLAKHCMFLFLLLRKLQEQKRLIPRVVAWLNLQPWKSSRDCSLLPELTSEMWLLCKNNIIKWRIQEPSVDILQTKFSCCKNKWKFYSRTRQHI